MWLSIFLQTLPVSVKYHSSVSNPRSKGLGYYKMLSSWNLPDLRWPGIFIIQFNLPSPSRLLSLAVEKRSMALFKSSYFFSKFTHTNKPKKADLVSSVHTVLPRYTVYLLWGSLLIANNSIPSFYPWQGSEDKQLLAEEPWRGRQPRVLRI